MRTGVAILMGMGLATLGCQSFQRVNLQELERNGDVKAQVTPSYAEDFSRYLEEGRESTIKGSFLERTDGELLLLVPVTLRGLEGREETTRQRVTIPFDEILGVRQKRQDPWRTGLLVTGSILFAGYHFYDGLLDDMDRKSESEEQGPVHSVILLRLPIG